MKIRFLIPLCLAFILALIRCSRVGKLETGKYAVADQEYGSQNYSIERHFHPEGGFEEMHTVDHCLLMEMTGNWKQDGGLLTLTYAQVRNRRTCHDSLPAWDRDSSDLKIPVRNVEATSYESLLAASGSKPEKWIKWLKTE